MLGNRGWIVGTGTVLLAGLALAAAPARPVELGDWTASLHGLKGPWQAGEYLPEADAPNIVWILLPLPERVEEPTPYVLQAASRSDVRRGAPAFALAVVLMTLGACTIALWAARLSSELALASFGLVGLLYGLRLAASSELSWWLVDLPPLAWSWTNIAVTYVIPVPWGLFFEQIAGRGWRSSIRRIWQISLAYALVALPIDIAAGVPGRAMGPNSFLVLLSVIVGLGNLFLGGVPKLAELPALRTGYVVFAVFVLAENLGAVGVLPQALRIEWVGVVVLLLCFGYAVAARTFRQQRQLSALEQELATARRIQRSLLPRNLPSLPWATLAVRYAPATAVAGDLYDFLAADKAGVGILLADVSGHGVPAALIASMVKMAAASQRERADRPGELLAAINAVLLGQLGSQFVTAVYVHADGAGRRVRLASAGHPPPLLWRRAAHIAQPIGDNGILMGQFPAAAYPTTELDVEPGDRLLLYTDGITEAADPSGEFFGVERLAAALADRADVPGEVFATHLLGALRAWTGKTDAFDDDVSFVVLDVLAADSTSPSPS